MLPAPLVGVETFGCYYDLSCIFVNSGYLGEVTRTRVLPFTYIQRKCQGLGALGAFTILSVESGLLHRLYMDKFSFPFHILLLLFVDQ